MYMANYLVTSTEERVSGSLSQIILSLVSVGEEYFRKGGVHICPIC